MQTLWAGYIVQGYYSKNLVSMCKGAFFLYWNTNVQESLSVLKLNYSTGILQVKDFSDWNNLHSCYMDNNILETQDLCQQQTVSLTLLLVLQ